MRTDSSIRASRRFWVDACSMIVSGVERTIEDIQEVILATSSTVEGDATAMFISDHIKDIKVSRISYGIPIGGELEYVDGNTIARAIQGRTEVNVD